MSQLPESFDFYLSNALAGDLKVLAHLFQGACLPAKKISAPMAHPHEDDAVNTD